MRPLKLSKLQSNLEIEIQKSEISRALILALLGILIAGFLTIRLFIDLENLNVKMDILILSMLLFGVYEFLFFLGMRSLQKRNYKLPFMARVMNSSFEIVFCFLVSIFALDKIHDSIAFDFPLLYLPFVLIMLSILRMDLFLSIWVGALSSISWIFYLFYQESFGLHSSFAEIARLFIYLVIGLSAAFISYRLRKNLKDSIRSTEEKSNILHVFGQHVSPLVVNKLLSQGPKEEGESRKVCVLFLDIRSFTSFSESKKPEEVVKFLNSVFDFMIEKINLHGGLVNKFLGDGFMAIFGAPIDDANSSKNAIQAALAIISELETRIASNMIPPIKIGIGIHTGVAMTGQIGSHSRKEYTIIGDVVNLASRVESLNKEFKTTLLLTHDTFIELENNHPEIKPFGEIEIRGRTQKIGIYGL